MNIVKQFRHANCDVKICYDEDAESPREWDNAGTMVCWHKRYSLGDEHNFESPTEFDEWWNGSEGDDAGNGTGGIRLPLYLYDHSGITMRCSPFSCPWDSGQVGWIYITNDKIHAEQFKDAAQTTKCLEGEILTYDDYLTGNVYGYIVEHESGESDSCWGFYGNHEDRNRYDYCELEARAAAEAIDAKEQREVSKVAQIMHE